MCNVIVIIITTLKKYLAYYFMISGLSRSHGTASRNTRWELILEFCKKRGGKKLSGAHRIAVCSTGDIAATDHTVRKPSAYLFNKDGKCKFTLKTTNPEGKLKLPCDVAVTSNNIIFITDINLSTGKSCIKIFDVNGSFVKSFSTRAPNEPEWVPSNKGCKLRITVSNQDEVVVGDWDRKVITIHTQSGEFIKKIATPFEIWYLTTNSHLIIFSDPYARKVVGMTREGRVMFTIDRFAVDGEAGLPEGITCDSNDDMYIAVMQVDEGGEGSEHNTGHIHQYDSNGLFTKCIIRGLYHPYGLAMSNGKLHIANCKSILVYGQE